MRSDINLAVVGATGLVGRKILKVLEERDFNYKSLTLLASEKSAGQIINLNRKEHIVSGIKDSSFDNIDIALFSAGGSASKIFAPIAAQSGCIVVDNSSAWRMDENVPLIVPEVNPDDLKGHRGIIANPNCSTIQMVLALQTVHELFGLKKVVCSTYQSISGAGQKGISQLKDEIEGRIPDTRISPYQLAYNTVFHSFSEGNNYTEEELKMVNEPRKILHLPHLEMEVTCVRIPVLGGHGESLYIETEKEVDVSKLKSAYEETAGIVLTDKPENDIYPMILSAEDKDSVFIGRIRKAVNSSKALNMWVVADNLRKGAATNAVQIAELIAVNDLWEFDL